MHPRIHPDTIRTFFRPHSARLARGSALAVALLVSAHAGGAVPLAALIREALDKNPSLQAARLQTEAAQAGEAQAGPLDPPQVGVEFYETPLASFPNPLRKQMETDYFLQQEVPFPGKRGARAQAEHWRGRSGEEQLQALADGLARDVKNAYYGLGLIDARLRGNVESQGLLRRLSEAARRQYEVGLGRQSDILRAQAELSSLENQARSLDAERVEAAADLNVLLDRPVDGAFDTTADMVPEPVAWDFERLRPLAEAHRPGLKALDADLSMRSAELSAARRDFLPDFTVKGAYKSMGESQASPHGYAPKDSWSVMLAMDLPVAPWSEGRYRAGYRIAKVNMERAGRERRAAAARVDAELRIALAQAGAAWKQWEAAGNALVPQAEQALSSSLIAYQTGKGDFMALLDAYRAALAARLERSMAAAKVMQSRAELERAVGMDLDSIPAEPGRGGKS